MAKYKLSRDAFLFLSQGMNTSLGESYDNFLKIETKNLLDCCGYSPVYSMRIRFMNELGIELRKLIHKHGRKTIVAQLMS